MTLPGTSHHWHHWHHWPPIYQWMAGDWHARWLWSAGIIFVDDGFYRFCTETLQKQMH